MYATLENKPPIPFLNERRGYSFPSITRIEIISVGYIGL